MNLGISNAAFNDLDADKDIEDGHTTTANTLTQNAL